MKTEELIVKKIITISLVVVATVLLNGTVMAQNSIGTAGAPKAVQAPGALANLPEADALIYLSPQRILTGAAPQVMAPAELEKMRAAFADVKKNAGFDPANISYVVFAMRFKKPSADLKLLPPEFMLIASGDFSAEAMMLLARQATEGKLRDEKYGTKTMGVMTIDDIAKEAEKTPFLKSLSEVAIAPLSGDTIAAGSTAYVKAAIDAAAGQERISADALNSLLRDPDALVSLAGSPLSSFARTLGLLGTEGHQRMSKCDTKFGDFYGAVTMDAGAFKVRGFMNADNPDTAQIITGLYLALLDYGKRQLKDQSAQTVLGGLKIEARDNDIVLQADIPQKDVADFIREQMKPAAKAATSAPPPAPAPPHKRTRRPVRHRVTKARP